MKWNSDVYDEFELVYEKIENKKEIFDNWVQLETAAIEEAKNNCGEGGLLAAMVGNILSPAQYDDLSDIDKQTSIKILGQQGIAALNIDRSNAYIRIEMTNKINLVKACTIFEILNRLEKIDGTQTMGTDKEKWTLELCVPLGGKKGLIQWEILIMQLYPWLSIREVSSNVISEEMTDGAEIKTENKINDNKKKKSFFCRLFKR